VVKDKETAPSQSAVEKPENNTLENKTISSHAESYHGDACQMLTFRLHGPLLARRF
jgi:hypothetical protein